MTEARASSGKLKENVCQSRDNLYPVSTWCQCRCFNWCSDTPPPLAHKAGRRQPMSGAAAMTIHSSRAVKEAGGQPCSWAHASTGSEIGYLFLVLAEQGQTGTKVNEPEHPWLLLTIYLFLPAYFCWLFWNKEAGWSMLRGEEVFAVSMLCPACLCQYSWMESNGMWRWQLHQR